MKKKFLKRAASLLTVVTLFMGAACEALAAVNPLTGDESKVPLVAGIGGGALLLIIVVLVLTGKKGKKKK